MSIPHCPHTYLDPLSQTVPRTADAGRPSPPGVRASRRAYLILLLEHDRPQLRPQQRELPGSHRPGDALTLRLKGETVVITPGELETALTSTTRLMRY